MAKHELDQLYVTNPTDKPFTVKWGGQPYTINPGEQKIWMRFLAEHFAKYLTDAILLQKEQEHKKQFIAAGHSEKDYMPKSFLNSRSMRPATVNTILTGVYQYHQGGIDDPNAQIQAQIDQMNQPAPGQRQEREMELDAGADPLMGVLKDDKPDEQPALPAAATPAPAGASMIPGLDETTPPAAQTAPEPADAADNGTDGRTMAQLREEAKRLDITIPFGANKDQVRELIKKQYA